jgi:fructokinase
MDIVCLGEILIDMFPAEVGRSLPEVTAFKPKPGGAPANVAVAATRLGRESAFIGKVGDDAFGHHLADILRQEGVNVDGMRYDQEARTGLAFLAMPDVNSYDILFYRNPGADMRLQADELDRELLQNARAFHFGSLSLIQEPSRSATLEAVKIAKDGGALISFDVNYRGDLWSEEEAYERVMATIPHVDLLKINEVELKLLGGSDDIDAVSSALLEKGPSLCVVTLGPDGSYFHIKEGSEAIPPFNVDTVDATGCGDAFIAGLLCRLVKDDSWQEQLTMERMRQNLRYANAVGALTALTLGVIPALPDAVKVKEFLAQQD